MQEDFDIIEEIALLMGDLARNGIASFQRGIEEKGLKETGDLLESFRSDIIREGFNIAIEISFLDYFRYKDRKVLDYSNNLPNPDDLEKFVLFTGIDKFAAMLPKILTSSRIPTASILAKKIALNIMFSRRKTPIVRRNFQGTVYNTRKMRLINTTSYRVRKHIAEQLGTYYAKAIEIDD